MARKKSRKRIDILTITFPEDLSQIDKYLDEDPIESLNRFDKKLGERVDYASITRIMPAPELFSQYSNRDQRRILRWNKARNDWLTQCFETEKRYRKLDERLVILMAMGFVTALFVSVGFLLPKHDVLLFLLPFAAPLTLQFVRFGLRIGYRQILRRAQAWGEQRTARMLSKEE